MLRSVACIAAVAALAAPTTAQMNPAAIGGGLVMPAAINAQAKRSSGGSASPALQRQNRANCANMPQYRRNYGANDPDVRTLEGMCRRLGYSMGR